MIIDIMAGSLGNGGKIANKGHGIMPAAIYHILAYDHAQTVAVIIKPGSFHFDMLSEHVIAQLFHGADVINKGFIRGSRV